MNRRLVLLIIAVMMCFFVACGNQKWICDECGTVFKGKAYYGWSTDETLCEDCARDYWLPFDYRNYEKKTSGSIKPRNEDISLTPSKKDYCNLTENECAEVLFKNMASYYCFSELYELMYNSDSDTLQGTYYEYLNYETYIVKTLIQFTMTYDNKLAQYNIKKERFNEEYLLKFDLSGVYTFDYSNYRFTIKITPDETTPGKYIFNKLSVRYLSDGEIFYKDSPYMLMNFQENTNNERCFTFTIDSGSPSKYVLSLHSSSDGESLDFYSLSPFLGGIPLKEFEKEKCYDFSEMGISYKYRGGYVN